MVNTPSGVTDFDALLNPRGIAVVGASQELNRIGGQPVRNLTDFGFPGKVYPVNPKYTEIKGLPCYPDIASVPQPCDLAVIVVGAKYIPGIVEQCGKAGIRFAVILSAGFGEAGEEGIRLQAQLKEIIARTGVRVVGPNCVGVLNLKSRMFCGMGTGFRDPALKAGRVAMVTQSGGVGFSVVTLAERAGVGFNYVVSSGNEVDITTPELIDYFLRQDDIDIVAAYMEGVGDGRALLEVGQRALATGKPVIIWKSGNTTTGRQAAASHTANLTADYQLYRTAFRQGGFIEVRDVDDFVDLVQGYHRQRMTAGRNVAIVTTSGGAGVVLADHCEEHGLRLPPISDTAAAELRKVLPSFAAVGNPLDMTAQGQNDIGLSPHNRVVQGLLQDPAIDQIIVRNGNVHGASGTAWANELIEIAKGTPKPIFVSWGIVIPGTDPVVDQLRAGGVPCYPTPLRLTRAMGALTDFAERCRKRAAVGPAAARSVKRAALAWSTDGRTVAEREAKKLLGQYGIPGVREKLLTLAEVDALKRTPLSFPLAVKIESPDIPHKTEADAVRLNIGSLAALKAAAKEVQANALRYKSGAAINGILLQEMASGTECIAGVVNDPHFGPVVAFGLGGVLAELLKDVTLRFAPFDAAAAREMIAESKAGTLLGGYRGRPTGDLAALADTLSRLSWLAADHADRIAEIDINPLIVREAGKGVVAADALIVLKARTARIDGTKQTQ